MDKKTERINAIKKLVEKRKRRKLIINRSIIIFGFLILIGSVMFGIWCLLGFVFAIKEINTENTVKYDSSTIISVSGIEIGDNLCFLNSGKSENKICRELPYIESAKIKKIFPNKIQIETTLAEPKFYVSFKEKYLLISQESKVLEERDDIPSELPLIIGLNFSISNDKKLIYESEELKNTLTSVFSAFEDNKLFSITNIDFSEAENISVNYDDRIKILLGSNNDINYKLLTAHEIILNKIKNDESGVLDLSTLVNDNRSYFISDSKK